MITYKLKYSDGYQRIETFEDASEAMWFMHNEGDHLISFSVVTSEEDLKEFMKSNIEKSV